MLRSWIVFMVIAVTLFHQSSGKEQHLTDNESDSVPKDIRDGFYFGRSASLVLKPADTTSPDMLAIFVDATAVGPEHNGRIARVGKHEETLTELPIDNFADVVTRTLGVVPPNTKYQPSFVTSSDINRMASASVMVNLEGIGEKTLADHHLPTLSALRDGKGRGDDTIVRPATVTQASYPYSSVALSSSLATGRQPSQHGIVGKSWVNLEGQEIQANSDDTGSWSKAASVADIVQQSFEGKSLTVSASVNPQLAASFGIHSSLASAHPTWNSHTMSFSPEKGYTTSHGTSKLDISREELVTALSDLAPDGRSVLTALPTSGSTLHFDTKNLSTKGKLEVRFADLDGNQKTSKYDLSVPEEFAFFTEVQYLHSLAQRLDDQSTGLPTLVADNVPDFYAFTLSSLRGLTIKYGKHSPEVVGALHVLDAATRSTLDTFQALYPGRMFAQVVLLGSNQQKADPRPLYTVLNRLLPQQVSNMDRYLSHFPSLYLTGTESKAPTALSQLRTTLSLQLKEQSVPFDAYCPKCGLPETTLLEAKPQTGEPVAKTNGVATNDNVPLRKPKRNHKGTVDVQGKKHPSHKKLNAKKFKSQQAGAAVLPILAAGAVARYQITLWLAIGASLTLLFAVYAIGWMQFKRDTILYSTFNPDWEHRKKNK